MRYRVVTRWSSLNVRAGPGLRYRAVTQLPRGQVVEVLATVQNEDGIWHRVANGWCSWLYLEPVEQPPRPGHRPTDTPAPPPAFLNLTPAPLAHLQRQREKLRDAIERADQLAYNHAQVAAQHGSRRYQMDEGSRAASDLENLPRALGVDGEDEPGVRGLKTAPDVGIARELEGLAARYVDEAYHLRRELQRVERDIQYYRQPTPH
jgi:hypothetical protein